MHGVNRAEVKPGDKVVVFGRGPSGLGMILWLVERGVTDVIAIDLANERLDRALELGTRAAFNSGENTARLESFVAYWAAAPLSAASVTSS